MAENRFAKYANQPMIPGTGPKPPSGFAPRGQAPDLVPVGDKDPGYIGQVEAIKQGIQTDGQIRASAAAANIQAANQRRIEAERRAFEAQQAHKLEPQKLANIRAVQSQIDRLNELFRKGPGRTKGLAGWVDYLPTPKNAQFNSAAAGLGEVGLAAFRVPGVGGQSDAELRAFVDANRPSSRDYDKQSMEKVRNLQNRLDQTYRVYGIKRQKQTKTIDFNDLPE